MKHGRAIVRRMEPSWWNKMKKNEWKLSFLFLASVKIFSNLLLDSSHFISFHIVSSDGIRSAPRTACIFLSFYFSLAPVLKLRRTYIDGIFLYSEIVQIFHSPCRILGSAFLILRHMTLPESFFVLPCPPPVDYVSPPQSIC